MEEDNRPETTLASANLAELESSCSFELTRSRSNSDASSLTAENFKDILHQPVNDNCMIWTNEEHNKYLDYLEMSFVKQLHCSTGLLAWCTGQPDGRPPQEQFADFNRNSEQFTVLQDGQFPKLNSARDEYCSHTAAADKVDSPRSPWVYCLRQASKVSAAYSDLQDCHEFHGGEKHLIGKRTSSSGPASCSEQNHICYLCCQNTVGSIIEGAGQNFVDQDQQENPSIISRPKRLKTAVGDTSIKRK